MRTIGKKVFAWGEQYIEDAFWIWYRSGRVTADELRKLLPDREGQLPAKQTIYEWRSVNRWTDRADALDLQVTREVEKQAIQERVEMLRHHADVGRELLDKGIRYLRKNPLEDDRAAIHAIRVGSQLEMQSRGLPDAVFKAAEMSDQQLGNVIEKLMDKIPEGSLQDMVEVIEGEVKDLEDNADESEIV